jgi:hypothetical protein
LIRGLFLFFRRFSFNYTPPLASACFAVAIRLREPRCDAGGFSFQLGLTHMVVIRLARGGAKKRPFYNMVVDGFAQAP